MKYRHHFLASALATFAACGALPALANDCGGLRSFKIDGGTIVSAEPVPAPFQVNTSLTRASATVGVRFCRVSGVLTPAPNADINFEVWLPDEGYTGRFAGVGNGGFAGSIFYSSMARMINRGYAVFASDRGHQGGGGDPAWADNPEQVINFQQRADHLAAVASKAVVAKYYGKPANYSYWSGCSAGGNQAYSAALRYPEDFEGIIGGGPPVVSYNRYSMLASEPGDLAGMMLIHRIMGWAPTMTKAKLQMLSRASTTACDGLDGVRDGVIAEPGKCRFDPAALLCKPGQTTECLGTADLAAVRLGYQAGYGYGSEYFWWKTDEVIQNTPPYSPVLKRAWAALLDVPSPEEQFMKRFEARGGKFIAYTGTYAKETPGAIAYMDEMVADRQRPGMAPGQAIEAVNKYHRLFLMPGMEHCAGGPGANTINAPTQIEEPGPESRNDVISAIETWVEQGRPPEYIIATKYHGDDPRNGVQMTRPICPYPKLARWSGRGDSSDARNWSCVRSSR